MLATEKQGIPLTELLSSAATSEYHLLLPTLDSISVETRPNHPKKRFRKLIADKGYDAGWTRQEIRKRHMTPYIPKRRKRGEKDEPTYNERIKPYYRIRWIVERTFSWLGNYRRIVTRFERYLCTYQAFVRLACIMLCLNRVLK